MKKRKMIEASPELKDCVRKIMQYKYIEVITDRLYEENKITEFEHKILIKKIDKQINLLSKDLEVLKDGLRQKDSGNLH